MRITRTLIAAAFATFGSGAALAQCEFTAQLVVTQPTCGLSDGEIDLIISGGVAPYYVFWSDGPTTEDRTGLPAGAYDVTVYDNSGTGCAVKADAVLECEPEKEEDCQFRTQTMGGWGAPPNGNNPAMYLQNHFAACFPSGVVIGCDPGNTLTLTTSTAVKNFLPSGSTPGLLPGDLVNPGGAYSNVFAGQLTAAVINVTVDACDPDFGESAGWLGDAFYVGGPFDGMTVQQVIDAANQLIGGCGGSNTPSEFVTALTNLNENYLGGTVDNGYLECKKEEEEKSLMIGTGTTMSVFPNPASDQLNVILVSSGTGALNVQVMDLTGRVVIDLGNLEIVAGERNELRVATNGLQDGTYMLVINEGGEQQVQRFVVKH